ncbi:MAG: hypothetical protein ACI865_002014 [Flavobacteriaceae bacterium]|jgi:hypothetical protein
MSSFLSLGRMRHRRLDRIQLDLPPIMAPEAQYKQPLFDETLLLLLDSPPSKTLPYSPPVRRAQNAVPFSYL